MTGQTCFEVEPRAAGLVIHARGPLSYLEQPDAPQTIEPLLQQIEQHAAVRVVVDLDEPNFIGTCAIHALYAIWDRVRAGNGTMALCNVSPPGLQAISAARLDTLWKIYPTPEAALSDISTIEPQTGAERHRPVEP